MFKFTSNKGSSDNQAALAISTVAILIRCSFRVAELSGGFNGSLANNQASFMILDGAMMCIVVILLTRELLVTSIRGQSEGSGQNFGAAFSGKLKMVFQSITILVILAYVNYRVYLPPVRGGAPRSA